MKLNLWILIGDHTALFKHSNAIWVWSGSTNSRNFCLIFNTFLVSFIRIIKGKNMFSIESQQKEQHQFLCEGPGDVSLHLSGNEDFMPHSSLTQAHQ